MVPTAPGTFCALGAILADIRRDYVRTARHLIGAVTPAQNGWPAIAATLAELEGDARAWIALEGDLIGESDIVVSFNMRYIAQAYELDILVPDAERETLDSDTLAALFHAEHERRYGFCEMTVPVQTATVRLGVIGRVAPITLPRAPSTVPQPRGTRDIWHGAGTVAARLYARADIGAGARIVGPAIVEQLDTTIFILPHWEATADALGTLHITREQAA
jgi:N-methylhydantoinase A